MNGYNSSLDTDYRELAKKVRCSVKTFRGEMRLAQSWFEETWSPEAIALGRRPIWERETMSYTELRRFATKQLDAKQLKKLPDQKAATLREALRVALPPVEKDFGDKVLPKWTLQCVLWCISDMCRCPPDMMQLPRNEAKQLAYRIVYIAWLITDVESEDDPLWPWRSKSDRSDRTLKRSLMQHEVFGYDNTWRQIMEAALDLLQGDDVDEGEPEWSSYMTLGNLSEILDCNARQIKDKYSDIIDGKSRQSFRFRVDLVDAITVKHYEEWRKRVKTKKKPRGTSVKSRKRSTKSD